MLETQYVGFNTRKLVKNLGGVRKVVEAINRIDGEESITVWGVDKWQRRKSLPLLQLCKLAIMAKNNRQDFDIYDYILTKHKEADNEKNKTWYYRNR